MNCVDENENDKYNFDKLKKQKCSQVEKKKNFNKEKVKFYV